MKRKLVTTIVILFILTLIPQMSFADTTESISDSLIEEKMDAAVNLINSEDGSISELPVGVDYKKETYDLGDGCTLTVELEDKAENESSTKVKATSGASTLWKGYGNRYFTAKAKVSFISGSIVLRLENHYILSAKGIDENYGNSITENYLQNSKLTKSTPVITDATARTVGASDVNMYCNFKLLTDIDDVNKAVRNYRINSTVGFVDINTSSKEVKVKQSWNLVKL